MFHTDYPAQAMVNIRGFGVVISWLMPACSRKNPVKLKTVHDENDDYKTWINMAR